MAVHCTCLKAVRSILFDAISPVPQTQLDSMNFDTQACADVLTAELPIPSRSASPAPQLGTHSVLPDLLLAKTC